MSSVSYRDHFYSFERSSLIGVIPKWDLIRNSNEIIDRKKAAFLARAALSVGRIMMSSAIAEATK